MAEPVLASIDVLLGLTGIITFSAILLNNLRVLRNFTHNQDVSMTMFFLRRESVHSIRALVYGALVFAGTVIVSAFASLYETVWVDLAAKIGAAVFMMTYLLFYEVVARITGPGQDHSLWTRIVGSDTWSIGTTDDDDESGRPDQEIAATGGEDDGPGHDTDGAANDGETDGTDRELVPGPEGRGRHRPLRTPDTGTQDD